MKIRHIYEFYKGQKRPKLCVLIPTKAKRKRVKQIEDDCCDKLMACIDCIREKKKLCNKCEFNFEQHLLDPICVSEIHLIEDSATN